MAAEHQDDLLVIVNKSSPVNAIEKTLLKDLFLGKKKFSKDGHLLVPVDAAPDSATRALWRKRLLGLSRKDEDVYWQQEEAMLRATRPPSFKNTQKAVFKLKDAISYVKRSEYFENVTKVVLVIPGG